MKNNNRISISAGLNNRFVLRLVGIFLLLNLLVVATAGSFAIVNAEKLGAEIAQKIDKNGFAVVGNSGWTEMAGYRLEQVTRDPYGISLPQNWVFFLPEETVNAKRRVLFPGEDFESFIKHIKALSYRYEFVADDKTYSVAIGFERDVVNLCWVLNVLLVAEILFLIKNAISGSAQIRRKLKPIEDLAEAAQNLNAAGAGLDLSVMETLADKIDGINAAKLDTRISIDATQDELKDLAEAINGMLARINDAYRSQVRFVSDASHELRTPISVIQGYANLLERWGKDDEKTLLESISAIKDEASNMKSLVEQLLFLARGDNNTMTLQLEEFDLGELAAAVIKESQMIDAGNEYESQIEQVFLHADKGLIKQVLRILTDNAIKYSNAGGKIRIAVRENAGQAMLSVQDEGIGIPPESVPLIFDRFYRADQSRARATGGTGLGLSIAKWIVERHGGHMEVVSREGLGTRVTVTFPAFEKAENH
ncbi:MAG: ATP-binding protein [Eubacteriales bacterium]|nr:ATP-binding protein [Eubacteriales bacterium]